MIWRWRLTLGTQLCMLIYKAGMMMVVMMRMMMVMVQIGASEKKSKTDLKSRAI